MASDRLFRLGLPALAVVATLFAGGYAAVKFGNGLGDLPGIGKFAALGAESSEAGYEVLIKQHPDAGFEWKEVPEAENGYLLLDQLQQSGTTPISNEFLSALTGQKAWDERRIDILLKSHQQTLDQLTRIGYLRNQSSAFLKDDYRIPDAQWAGGSGCLLIADARRAAEKGNFEHARSRIYAALGIAAHYDQIETASIYHLTISHLIRLQALETATRHVLNRRSFSRSELLAWQSSLRFPEIDSQVLARVLRADAWTSTRSPILDTEPEYKDMSEGRRTAHAVDSAASLIKMAAKIETASLASLISKSGSVELPNGLSTGTEQADQDLMDVLQGLAIFSSREALHVTALHLALGQATGLEPLTGQPFVLRKKSNTVSLPSDPMFMDPLPERLPIPKTASSSL